MAHVVDEHIDPPDGGRQPGHGLAVPDVEHMGRGPVEGGDRGLGALGVDVDDVDPRPFGRQGRTGRPPDAPGPAGDHGDPTLEQAFRHAWTVGDGHRPLGPLIRSLLIFPCFSLTHVPIV